MARSSGAKRVSDTLVDATGRTEGELIVGLSAIVAVAGLIAGLRFLKFLGDLGSDVLGRSRS